MALVTSAAKAAYDLAFLACVPPARCWLSACLPRTYLFPSHPDGCREGSSHPSQCRRTLVETSREVLAMAAAGMITLPRYAAPSQSMSTKSSINCVAEKSPDASRLPFSC